MIQWNDNYTVKVSELDEQHKKLIKMINELSEAMTQGKGKEIIKPILQGLVSYTRVHFQNEEKYFQQFNYSDSSQHISQHQAFIQKINEFQNDYNNGNIGLSIKVMNFLSDWLIKHIQGTDKQYSACFNENGLS